MGIIENQRRLYAQYVSNPSGRFSVDRPAIFSPAVAAQVASGNRGLFFQWTPLFIPFEFTSYHRESTAHVESCYIGDWSAIGKVRVRGSDALAFLRRIGMNNLDAFEIGQIKHHVQLSDAGYVAAEGVLYRTGPEEFIATPGNTEWMAYQFGRDTWNAELEDLAPELFIFEVQGPTSLYVLEAATGESLRDIAFNRSRMTHIRGIPVRILRTGISGELGYELHGSADQADAIWEAVVAAGARFDIRCLGIRSQLVQHIEAGIATNGLDYVPAAVVSPGAPKLIPPGGLSGSFVPTAGVQDYFRYPSELGWGGRGRLSEHDFIGRAALQEQARQGGPARTLMGLTWNAHDVVDLYASQFQTGDLSQPMDMPRRIGASFDRVVSQGRTVGVSSSRTYSTHLRKMISLAVLEKSVANVGRELSVLWGDAGTVQREIRAVVTALPFKQDRRRTDVSLL